MVFGDVEGRPNSPHSSSSWQGSTRFLKAVQYVKKRDPKDESPTPTENPVLIYVIRYTFRKSIYSLSIKSAFKAVCHTEINKYV